MVEVDMPVCPLGCRRNRFLDGACHPDKIPAQRACRIGLANRQRIEGCDDVGSSHERHDGFTQGREFDCSNYRATWNAPVGWRAQYRALTNLCQPIAPSQRQGFAALRLRLPLTPLRRFFTEAARWDLANDS